MGLKKWIQRKVCDGMWSIMTRMEKEVIIEFSIDLEKKTEAAIHRCECEEGRGEVSHDHAGVHDHECKCITANKLIKVEQEWIDRGIIA